MSKFIFGTSAFPTAEPALLQVAGIGWVRQDFPYPFQDGLGGTLSPH